ncbi:MAG TPA: methylated-DNA--[protein]-cysteine S-methyltransferase [Opitutaceae bacterium]|jgi:methylated-DNA-[protein]-cysteine S-methyltransferase|nr:methylated-DNA--[protein]-cysteine S-methyltransferase [Opitutaceae bacterium]
MAFTLITTSFGTCGIAWNEVGFTRFLLPSENDHGTEKRMASSGGGRLDEDEAPDWVRAVITRVRRHLDRDFQDFSDVPLDKSQISDFQDAVYLQTLAIRPGFKKSYGEVAKAIGMGPEASRAVGVALATNPWPLLVPCHRVVSASDKMTGFSAPGGIRTKTRLLAIEGAELLSE